MFRNFFGVDKVQALYDALYAKGVQSKVDALQVGCMVKVTDVEDLDHFIETAEAKALGSCMFVYAAGYEAKLAAITFDRSVGTLSCCAT